MNKTLLLKAVFFTCISIGVSGVSTQASAFTCLNDDWDTGWSVCVEPSLEAPNEDILCPDSTSRPANGLSAPLETENCGISSDSDVKYLCKWCASPDSDDDGCLDAIDNEPLVAGVDTDSDGVADYCDDDDDNDGVTDEVEVAFATDPLNAASTPVFLAEEQYADADGDGDIDGDDLGQFAKVYGMSLWFVDLDRDGYGDPAKGFYWAGQPGPADLFVQKNWNLIQVDLDNEVTITLRRIPSGAFIMGSPTDEPDRRDDEPQHGVILSEPFYMMTTEVTQGLWEKVMGANPSHYSDSTMSCDGYSSMYCPGEGSNAGPDAPVENVSWDDVQGFIAALNTLTGHNFQLPTEAQWEYAARAGTITAFASGELTGNTSSCSNPVVDSMAWYCYQALSGGTFATKPVAQKAPNAWGLYDMHGNAWEWVQDWDGDYPTTVVTDPTGPTSGSVRVFRGGSWSSYPFELRSAFRISSSPGNRWSELGFRLALPFGQ